VTVAALAGAPGTLDFGTTNQVGNPVTQDVTITNGTATSQTSGALSVTLSDNANFSVTGCAVERVNGIIGGANCVLHVTYQPTTVGTVSATLTVTASPGSPPNVVTTLAGTSAPSITVGPTTHAFAAMGDTQQFTITLDPLGPPANPTPTGALAVTISNATDFAITLNDCSGRSLQSAAPALTVCHVTVQRMTATAGTSATLNIASPITGNSISAAITGT
jgi:hypothetical protein